MSAKDRDIRCKKCKALLGRIENGLFVVKRGGLQIAYDGNGNASLVCYKCRTLTVLKLPIIDEWPPEPERVQAGCC